MKVLHIISGLDQGGAEAALYRLVTFRTGPVEHIIVSMMDLGVYGPKFVAAGIVVHTLGLRRGKLSFASCTKLFRIIRDCSPDVIQTWMYHADLFGGIIGRIAGIRRVYWGVVASNLDVGLCSTSTIVIARLCAFFSRFIPYKIVTCSKSSIPLHLDIGYSNRFLVIPLGCDGNEFVFSSIARNSLRREWGVGEGDVVIGCVARWDPFKGHGNLIGAFSKLIRRRNDGSGLKCVLIGPQMDGDNPQLDALIKSLYGDGNDLIRAGRVQNISSVMSAIDLHVLSSLGEGFPNVVIEAMLCSTPCVVTDVGDAAMMVGGTGWVVPPGNIDALTNALATALEEMSAPLKWALRRDSCRERSVQNFSLENMVNQYVEAWSC